MLARDWFPVTTWQAVSLLSMVLNPHQPFVSRRGTGPRNPHEENVNRLPWNHIPSGRCVPLSQVRSECTCLRSSGGASGPPSKEEGTTWPGVVLHTFVTLCSCALKITSGWCYCLHLTNEEIEARRSCSQVVGPQTCPFPKPEPLSLTGVITPVCP